MDRRAFLSALMASGALYGTAGLPGLTPSARASEFALTGQRFLISVLLRGGPDFRHLFPPAFSDATDSFGYGYWHATSESHATDRTVSALDNRWQNDYFHITHQGQEFGLLKSCAWLKSMWDEGNVAIINNVLTTSTRNHPLGILMAEQGKRDISSADNRNPGWGGLLADITQKNVLSLTRIPRDFCFGASPTVLGQRSDERVVTASNSRSMTLFEGDPLDSTLGLRSSITRSLNSYYKARRGALANIENTARFAEHERKLRAFAEPFDERLQNIPLPQAIEKLYDVNGVAPLFEPNFGQQIRNLYDCLAAADLLNMGIASMEYRGWDTHRNQKAEIEPRLFDLFGAQQALHSLFDALPTQVADNIVIALQGEFGRQIRANGDGGTDHGEGGTVILIGRQVNGGIYGELFPNDELSRLADPSPQIKGKTAVARIYATLSDWLSPGASEAIFPQLGDLELESGLSLNSLLT